MSEPAKKPGQQPEGYQPKKPEIVGMVEAAQGQTEAQGAPQAVPAARGGGKQKIDFNIPFSVFAGTNFVNCFASTYMYLEGIGVGDTSDQYGDNNQYFCLFDTMCGRSALRRRFSDEPTEMQMLIEGEVEDLYGICGTDDTVDFLFGFAGYAYRKLTDSKDFMDAIRASIDAGRPVIAKVKAGKGLFRVITGYDGKKLLGPDYKHAHHQPKKPPKYDELAALYIIGGKTAPRYTLSDALERIRQVMEYNIKEKLWDGCIEKMGGWLMFPSADGWEQAGAEERKARLARLKNVMWYAMNCHTFGETFRNRYHEELRNPAFDGLWKKISGLCYSIDALIYGIDCLNGQLDWSKIHSAMVPGISAMIVMTLEKVKQMDVELLGAIIHAQEILREESA